MAKKTKPDQRLSLYGMTPEDALRKALGTTPSKPQAKPAKKLGGKKKG